MLKNTKIVGSALLVLSVLFIIIGFSVCSGSAMEHAKSECNKWEARYSEWQTAKVEARKVANERGQKTSEAIEIAQEQADHCIYWILEWQSDIKALKAKATICFVLGAISTVVGAVVFSIGGKHKEKYDGGGSLVDAKTVKIK